MAGTTLTRSRALRRASPSAPPRATTTITPALSSPAHASYPASGFVSDDAYPAPRRNPHYPRAEAPQPQPPVERDALIFRIAADAFDACFQHGMDSERRPMCPLMVRT